MESLNSKTSHSHEHNHHVHHHHSGHHHEPTQFGTAFAIGISLNLIYVLIEVIWGIFANSLALIADGGHNLSDVLSLCCAWVAAILSRRRPTSYFTYGLRRTSILTSLGNAILLLIVTGGIIWEAILRFIYPAPVQGKTVIIIAFIGIIINGFTACLFISGSKKDLNIKGAFLHMAYDALLSFAVVVTGILIMLTGYVWLDPTISLLVSIVIIIGTWSLLKDSVTLALDGVPANINPQEVENYLRALPGIVDIHDFHIWAMSTTETALTAHLVTDQSDQSDQLLHKAADTLKKQFQIGHATFQLEHIDKAKSCLLFCAETI